MSWKLLPPTTVPPTSDRERKAQAAAAGFVGAQPELQQLPEHLLEFHQRAMESDPLLPSLADDVMRVASAAVLVATLLEGDGGMGGVGKLQTVHAAQRYYGKPWFDDVAVKGEDNNGVEEI